MIKIKLLFGYNYCKSYDEAIQNNDINLLEELEELIKIYEFENENEAKAFLKGVREAVGYFDYIEI